MVSADSEAEHVTTTAQDADDVDVSEEVTFEQYAAGEGVSCPGCGHLRGEKHERLEYRPCAYAVWRAQERERQEREETWQERKSRKPTL